GTGNLAQSDVILALEVPDLWSATHSQTPVNRMGMESKLLTKAGAKVFSISSLELLIKSNYQDFGRYSESDLVIAGDAEATLPSLVEACKRLITPDRQRVFEQRGARYIESAKRIHEQTLQDAAWSWDASP